MSQNEKPSWENTLTPQEAIEKIMQVSGESILTVLEGTRDDLLITWKHARIDLLPHSRPPRFFKAPNENENFGIAFAWFGGDNARRVQTWCEALRLLELSDIEQFYVVQAGADVIAEIVQLKTIPQIIYAPGPTPKDPPVVDASNGAIVIEKGPDIPYEVRIAQEIPEDILAFLDVHCAEVAYKELPKAFKTHFARDYNLRKEFDVYEYARAVSLDTWQVPVPAKGETDDIDSERLTQMLSRTSFGFGGKHNAAAVLDSYLEQLENYECFWLTAIEGSPFKPYMGMFTLDRLDSLKQWGGIVGVDAMIEAYVAGVPAEDIANIERNKR